MFAILALACTPSPDTDATLGDTSDAFVDTGDPGHDSGEPDVDPDQQADNLATTSGDYAADFLSGREYDRIVVEVDWVAGAAPDNDALDAMRGVLESLCDKPGGVEIVLDDELPTQGSPAWSVAAGEQLEIAWRDRYRDAVERSAVLYLLYLDGNSDRDSSSGRVLGYAYHGSSVVMFPETIDSAGGSLPLLVGIEDTVLAHEAGHILGLVNNGAPMLTEHEDPEHSHHDANQDCLMYWAVETDAVADILGASVPEFDAECLADMAAVREE